VKKFRRHPENAGVGRVFVVLPALNEEPRIGRTVRGITRLWNHQVIVVDDGSTDRTSEMAKRAGAIPVRHPRNRGVGAALRTGYQAAIRMGADTLVTMGADDQDNASEMPRLLKRIAEGADFVQGSRWKADGRVVNIPMFRRITTIVYSLLFTLLTGRRITDGTNGYRAFRASLLREIDISPKWMDSYELEPYLYYRAVVGDYRVEEAPVTKRYPKNRKGYTKMRPFRDWWRILRPLILLGTGIRH